MITSKDFINIRLLAAAAFAVALTGCSRNAIEGDVVFVGHVPRPASGVVVVAATGTDIKENQAKAYKSTQTDSSGHFRISGLLATTYRVGIPKDSNPASNGSPIYVPVPQEGTYLIKERIVVCPVPPSAGVWAYIDATKPPKQVLLDQRNKVQLRVHEGLIQGGFGSSSAFSLSEADAKNISARVGQEGFLVLSDAGVSDVARLWHIQAKTVLGTQIDTGWYYNVRDFVEKPLLIAPILGADVRKPMMQGVFTSDDRPLVAIPFHNLAQGLYMLTTSIASGQRAGQVLGGESHPKEGFLIQIDPATKR